jgi:putative DNA primase/helicase
LRGPRYRRRSVQGKTKVATAATGRWQAILSHFGVEERFLRNSHGECPHCGGKDRYRFDDMNGRGTWFCSQCGYGDGFDFLQRLKGWTFNEAALAVEAIVSTVKHVAVRKTAGEEEKLESIRGIWNSSLMVQHDDPVWKYLNNRLGMEGAPVAIRFHPSLPYYEDGKALGNFPALVARICDENGNGVGIHRIYLTPDGRKADVSSPKKMLAAKPINGGAVRLSDIEACLGIAEGIETALAASARFDVPVWSCLSAVGMEKWVPPAGVERVIIFADNDMSFTGHAAAYALAKRLHRDGLGVEVRIPEQIGTDWADL